MTAVLPAIGTIGFGVVGNYPPTHWKYIGTFQGSHVLWHVKPAAQSTPYSDQVVSREIIDRLFQETTP